MPELTRDVPTIADVLGSATRMLAAVSATPRLDAELLLAETLAVDRTRLTIDARRPLDGEAHERFDRLARRRRDGEPVAYLLGRRDFRRLTLAVDRRVLIPRPESELLVEIGLALPRGASVLDVGTGSGAVALALADERPDLRLTGVDVSPDALAVAEANRSTLSLDVSFTVSDLLGDVNGPFDAVLANLPYVADDAALPVDIADHEPALALFGGADGSAVIRRLLAQAAGRPWPALIALEIGETQGEAVAALVRAAGFSAVRVQQDLSGRDRVVVGTRERERERER